MKKKKLIEIIEQAECELSIIYQKLNMPLFEDMGMAGQIALGQICGDIDQTREMLKYMNNDVD